MGLIDHSAARHIANAWLNAFNDHRADLVVEHFAEDVTATSPAIAMLRPQSGGTLRGKPEVLAFYEEGLQRVPDLQFRLVEVLTGIDQVTIVYHNQRQTLVAETLTLGPDATVRAVHVTYGPTPT